MSGTPVVTLERLYRALGDATRLRILGLLMTGEVCVCHIHESLKIPQPKASRHLAYLKRSGLVQARRQGLWVYYRLAPLSDPMARVITAAATDALGTLDMVQRDTERLRKKRGACAPDCGR